MNCFFNFQRDFLGGHEFFRIFSDRFTQSHSIHFLKSILPSHRGLIHVGRIGLPCDEESRRGVEIRIGDAGDKISSAGTGSGDGDTQAAGYSSVGVGGHSGGLFVVSLDVFDINSDKRINKL